MCQNQLYMDFLSMKIHIVLEITMRINTGTIELKLGTIESILSTSISFHLFSMNERRFQPVKLSVFLFLKQDNNDCVVNQIFFPFGSETLKKGVHIPNLALFSFCFKVPYLRSSFFFNFH